ncbi:MAG: adenine phosphoribosyltransferase [Myxococcales bacterium]|nr:adenine phosphoribosyltransferase [Myxococcales bacterium]
MNPQQLAALIRDVPDFPKPGILFKDITTLIADPAGFKTTVDVFVERYRKQKIDKILGIESRGFIFGGAVAYALGCGFQVVRKPGKLPYKTKSATYQLEYGSDQLEIHEDAVRPGERVVLLDDLLATGGTMNAVAGLVRDLGAVVVECAFVIELEFLKGREKLGDWPVFSLVRF